MLCILRFNLNVEIVERGDTYIWALLSPPQSWDGSSQPFKQSLCSLGHKGKQSKLRGEQCVTPCLQRELCQESQKKKMEKARYQSQFFSKQDNVEPEEQRGQERGRYDSFPQTLVLE